MDFWNDLLRLSGEKNHYIGVLTLEPVGEDIYDRWIDDLWLIKSRKFAPYYVVDGQQRLTTSVLLIRAIVTMMEKKSISKLNYASVSDITRRFISESKDENQSRSYLFGYEEDNPSYSYLIDKIYGGRMQDKIVGRDTVYTINLSNAIRFFEEELDKLDINQLEIVFTKATQHFLFNTYIISSDIDVFVTFETMNNRGKPLSYLELLKNRLIYLSTLFPVDSDVKSRLRRDVNECWKIIYYVLGQRGLSYLADDDFLDAHFYIYFCQHVNEISKKYRNGNYVRQTTPIYDYLLDEYFVAQKVTNNELNTCHILNYIESLKVYVKIWYAINSPEESGYSEEIIEYLKKLNYTFRSRRIRGDRFIGPVTSSLHKVMLLSYMNHGGDDKLLLKFLKVLERFIFLKRFVPFECYGKDFHVFDIDPLETLAKLEAGEISQVGVIEKIDKINNAIISDEQINAGIILFYSRNGFYETSFLHYFLCEYELHLMKVGKSAIEKLDREGYFGKGYSSIEHIYPQEAKRPYWTDMFKRYMQKQKTSLKNSLGNFVAVSEMKNSSLGSKSFPEKRDGGQNLLGYKFGTYAEMEIARNDQWGAKEILERGLRMITFLQNRWGFKVGKTKADKIEFLGLSFLHENIGTQKEPDTSEKQIFFSMIED